MIRHIRSAKEALGTATFRESGITFTGTFLAGFFSAIFYILTARILGPHDFGIFMVAVTTLTMLADVANLGTDTGIVRFVSLHLSSDRDRAYRFLKAALEVKLVIAAVLILLGWLASTTIANVIFAKPELAFPLHLAFVGAAGYELFSFTTATFQAFQRFWHWSITQLGINLARLIAVLILLFMSAIDLNSTLWLYILMPFLGFAAAFLFIPKDFLGMHGHAKIRSEFFHYNKWVALFTLFAAIADRTDTFISTRLLSFAEVGYYSASLQLVVIVPQLVTALGAVFSPKFASFTSLEQVTKYLKKSMLFVLALSGMGLLAIPVVFIIIPLIWPQYADYVPGLFVILLGARLIFLISTPIHNAILYYFGNSKFFVFLSLLQLVIVTIVGWVLISKYGTTGAAATVFVSSFAGLAIPSYWLVRKITFLSNSKQSLLSNSKTR